MNFKKNSIFKKILLPLLAVMILQAIISYRTNTAGGTIKLLRDNSIYILNQDASKRKIELENNMVQRWTNLGTAVNSINKITEQLLKKEPKGNTIQTLQNNSELALEWVKEISEHVLSILRNNGVSGAFAILNTGGQKILPKTEQNYKGVYFRDTDPSTNLMDYTDILMERGSAEVARLLNIRMDTLWRADFNFVPYDSKNSMPYFFEPFLAACKNYGMKANDMGYWSSPFYLSEDTGVDSVEIITYSMPLIYQDGTPYGVIGVEISLEELYNILPFKEIDEHGRGGYMLVSYDKEAKKDGVNITATVEAVFGNGLKNVIGQRKEVIFIPCQNEQNLFRLNNLKYAGEDIYGVLNNLTLYNTNTPFSRKQWVLAAISNEDNLFGIADKIKWDMLLSTGIALLIGIFGILWVSNLITKPIRKLVEKLKRSSPNREIKLEKLNVSEIDELSSVIEELSRKQRQIENDLEQERERYLVALESAADIIIEYDREKDQFIIFRFLQQDGNSELKNHIYTNFRHMILRGSVCHEDDIENLLCFMDGQIEQMEVRIKQEENASNYLWFFVKGKTVKDNRGNITRIIGNTRDVTKEKEKEFDLLEKSKHDQVTGLYKREVGEELITEYLQSLLKEEKVCFCIIDFKEFQNLNQYYGLLFCDILLEEIGHIIKQRTKKEDIRFRLGGDEFAIFSTHCTREEFYSLGIQIQEEIEHIELGGNEKWKLECRIGIIEEKGDTSYQRLYNGAVVALNYAQTEEKNICTYQEIQKYKKESSIWKPSLIVEHQTFHDSIISFTSNVLEKTSDVKSALPVLLGKIGRQFKLRSILIVDSNPDYCTDEILCQWNIHNLPKYKRKLEHSLEQDFLEKTLKFEEKGAYIRNCGGKEKQEGGELENSQVRPEGSAFCCAMYDNGAYAGNIIFESAEVDYVWKEEEKTSLQEIVKIIAAHISKSKSDLASKAKSEFLSRMSHEIRTPMNGIIGMTAIAKNMDMGPEKIKDCLDKIDTSAQYLLSLINDILDMSRIESGKMKLKKELFNIKELVKELDILIRPQAESKNLHFIIEQDLKEEHVIGDSLKLNQVLINILGNAVKFTKADGFIWLKVKQTAKELNNVTIYFSIKDTGIGISKEDTTRIFEAFEQAGEDTLRKQGGTGLGLAISSNLVKMMGGKIEIQSELGQGTEFYFKLSFKIPKDQKKVTERETKKSPQPSKNFDGKKLLLVEDNELNAEIAKTILEMAGFIVENAENGKEAVDYFEEKDSYYYDVILMDIRMPIMDGLEATRRIRTLGKEDSRTIPIIAMTANAFDEDMNKSIESGMNGHLSKPIDLKKLYEVLERELR